MLPNLVTKFQNSFKIGSMVGACVTKNSKFLSTTFLLPMLELFHNFATKFVITNFIYPSWFCPWLIKDEKDCLTDKTLTVYIYIICNISKIRLSFVRKFSWCLICAGPNVYTCIFPKFSLPSIENSEFASMSSEKLASKQGPTDL